MATLSEQSQIQKNKLDIRDSEIERLTLGLANALPDLAPLIDARLHSPPPQTPLPVKTSRQTRHRQRPKPPASIELLVAHLNQVKATPKEFQ